MFTLAYHKNESPVDLSKIYINQVYADVDVPDRPAGTQVYLELQSENNYSGYGSAGDNINIVYNPQVNLWIYQDNESNYYAASQTLLGTYKQFEYGEGGQIEYLSQEFPTVTAK